MGCFPVRKFKKKRKKGGERERESWKLNNKKCTAEGRVYRETEKKKKWR